MPSCSEIFEGILSCYFWERKFTAILAGIIIAVATYYGLKDGAKVNFTYSTIGAAVLGITSANLLYVIITESFCTSGPCNSQGPCMCEACVPCARVKVYTDA